jgi:P pilus assembly chaperone PapD
MIRQALRPTLQARLTIAFAALLAIPAVASAQIAVDRGDVQLRPGRIEDRVAIINVRNDGKEPVQASVLLEDWDRDEKGTNRWFKAGSVAGSCGERLTIFPRAIQLAPGQEQAVRVVLDSASKITDECWSAAIVQVARAGSANGRSAQFNIRTAVKLYVTPAGLPVGGEVTDILVERDSVDVLYTNTGKRHGVASGRVEFRNADDRVAATLPLPDIYVLPGTTRRVKLAVPKLAAGRYVVLAVVDFGGDELAAGQAELEVKTP